MLVAALAVLVLGTGPLGLFGADGVAAQDRWSVADSATVRIAPAEFAELPYQVVQELVGLGCVVPQATWERPLGHNVVQGQFAAQGQTDWAVLCSQDLRSSVVVFWGGAMRCDSEFAAAADLSWLQEVGGGEIEFSRLIELASPERVRVAVSRSDGSLEPSEVMHDGIEQHFLGKASTIFYCEGGEWLERSGLD